MCTVSYFSTKEKVIITSNRDENIFRPLAKHPTWYVYNQLKLCYPEDPLKGGSWFIINEFGTVFVLLNGGHSRHISMPPYRVSRGLVLIEIAASSNWQTHWDYINLFGIEPFTIIVYKNHSLHKCIWDGNNKYLSELDAFSPCIWSSSTLYNPEIIEIRKQWFTTFLNENSKLLDEKNLIDFHTMTKREDLENGLIIHRNNEMLTKNITQVVLEKSKFTLMHKDLITKQVSYIKETIPCN